MAPTFHILNGVIVVVVFFGDLFGISSPERKDFTRLFMTPPRSRSALPRCKVVAKGA